MSSSDSSCDRPPTNIFPCLALAFFGSTFLLLMMWSPAATTLSIASALLNTIKAKPLDLPVLGSVLTFMLSMAPYLPKCSLSSAADGNCQVRQRIVSDGIIRSGILHINNFIAIPQLIICNLPYNSSYLISINYVTGGESKDNLPSVVSQLRPPTNNFLQ